MATSQPLTVWDANLLPRCQGRVTRHTSLWWVKWSYKRRIDAVHAWGVVALGTTLLVAIPTILVTLHSTDSHFRWWWPSNWMAVPASVVLIGLGLAVFPVRRPEQAAQLDAQVSAVGDPGGGNSASSDHTHKSAGPPEFGPVPGTGRVVTEPVPGTESAGHAFISYVREDARQVDQLQRDLQAAGVLVWRDTADLWPGEDWRLKIRRAITDNALVFIACFSAQSTARAESYQNEELALAIDQLRRRPPDVPWLIPVRFDDCRVPDIDIGAGRTISSLQRADLFGEQRDVAVGRLLATVLRLLGQKPSTHEPGDDPDCRDEDRADSYQASQADRDAANVLAERFRAQWADDISLFSNLKRQPSFQDTAAALRRSSKLHIISKHGIRASLEHTSMYVRIPHPDDWPAGSVIPLHVEARWMETISLYEWTPSQSFADAFFSIATALRSIGRWEGERNYDPDATFEQFADLLLYGVEAIRQGFGGVINRIFQIVGNDWVVTEWELIDKENQYQILFSRLNELDWISHVTDKGWVNRGYFLEAFGIAEMLVHEKIFEGNLPPDWKLPTVWPFKTMLDGGIWDP